MTLNRNKHLALSALALAGTLVLSACGAGGDDTASTGSSSTGHAGGHDSDSAKGNDADVAFAAAMVPHHAQAVEMSDIILSKNPPAEVASLARQIKDAQAPEIEQLNTILADLGASTDLAEHGEHVEHGGMMSDGELAQLKAATGGEAVKLYLQFMIEHHQGAIEASDKEIAEGTYGPAIELAEQIKQAQAAEITTMEKLLTGL